MVSEEGRGSGGCAPGKNFHFHPQNNGVYKISCARKITKQKKPLPDERLKYFLKKSCVWPKDRRSTKCKTVSERRTNLSLHGVCGLGVFEETLAICSASFNTYAQKHGELRCGPSFNFDTKVCLHQW